MKFKPQNDIHFSNLNQQISVRLKDVNTYRFGAEILADRLSFRGGYMIEDSPYKSLNNSAITDTDNNIDESTSGFSLGLGYKMNQSTIDLSFVKLNFTPSFLSSDTEATRSTDPKNNLRSISSFF